MANIIQSAAGRINTTPLDLNGNLQKILKLCGTAQSQGIKFIAFPELVLTGYNCGDLFSHPNFVVHF